MLTGYARVSNDGESPETWLPRAAALKKKHGNGNGVGIPLSIAVQLMYPTPPRTAPSPFTRTRTGDRPMFRLIDTNTYHFNCGHYPHFEVRPVGPEMPPPREELNPRTGKVRLSTQTFETAEAADDVARRLNKQSSDAWHDFLNG
jgi:hypothetical protein